MTDITIHLRDAGERWVIQLDGPDDHYEVEIEPLSVEIPSTVRDLSDDARTWDRLPDHFAPTLDTIQPGLPVLKDLGSYLQRTLLGHAEFARRLTAQRQSAPEHRLLFETGDHGLLRQLPLELLFDDDRQQFLKREPGLVSVRTIRNAKWQWLELPKRARVVIATAHSDSEPRPTADELAAHANALADEITKLGWEPIAIPNATAESLRAAVRDGVDLLYVACHGQPDEDHAGRLHLRDRTVSGSELGEWIDDANATITAVLLCACSTAVPGRSGNTHGMAEYLARKVTAALGFRAPVSVSWALSFTQRMFDSLANGHTVDAAFCEARRRSDGSDPQWALPLLYTRRAPQRGLSVAGFTPRGPASSQFRSRLPQQPRSYFTGRTSTLARLGRFLDNPGTAVVVSVEGQGGMGKTEIARWLAHTAAKRHIPVIWLERPDKSQRPSLERMIQCVDPSFDLMREPELREGPLDRLALRMRNKLAGYRGLLVLDDLSSGRDLDLFHPNGEWVVVATTRVDHLYATVERIELDRMERQESIELLGRIRYGSVDAIPDGSWGVLDTLATALEDMPLALELAAHTMHEERLDPSMYLSDLQGRIGHAAADHARVTYALMRLLDEQDDDVVRVFRLLGAFPAPGARAGDVAVALGETEPVATRWLDLLTRVRLANYDVDSGLYWLHPRLRDEAWEWLNREPEGAALSEHATRALVGRAEWVSLSLGRSVEQARARWTTSNMQLSTLDPDRWVGRAGRQSVAAIVGLIDQFSAMSDDLDTRERRLESALALVDDVSDMPTERARLHFARGGLRTRRARLDDAEADYEVAVSLYRAVDDRLGQANVLLARGGLRTRRDRLDDAEADYESAIFLFRALGDHLGEANALKARGDLRTRKARLDDAEADYETAISLFRTVDDRLGEANALTARGALRAHRDKLDEAEADYEAAISLLRAVDDRLGEANALTARGDLRTRRDRLDDAEADYELAISLYRAVDARLGEANALTARGALRIREARLDDAEADYETAISLYHAVDSRLGEANALKARGDLRNRETRLDDAEADYELAISLYRAVADRRGEANALKARGDLRTRKARLDDAEADYELAISLYRAIDSRLGEANVLNARGDLRTRRGKLDDAEADYEAAISWYRSVGSRFGEANVLQSKGDLERERQRWSKALPLYVAARELYEILSDPLGLSNVDADLARTHSDLGDGQQAVEVAHRALVSGKQAQNQYAVNVSLTVLRQHKDIIPPELRAQLGDLLDLDEST
jgi:tetratricopeptide (TPR) repeat protein